jgi:hypothetical protein
VIRPGLNFKSVVFLSLINAGVRAKERKLADEDRGKPLPDGHGTPPQPPQPGDGGLDLWKFAGAGAQLAVTVLLFVGLGLWLDRRYGWSPWGGMIFGMLGVAAGLYHFVKDALR